jgi:hypothetical protein
VDKIRSIAVPESALLAKYTRAGAYTDCYTCVAPGSVSHAQFIETFYTTVPFKLERLILKWLVAKPSSDLGARELAAGTRVEFAAWTVEARAMDQLLMCDYMARTRSWLMVEPAGSAMSPATRLYFGSAVVPVADKASGELRLGKYQRLLGFHRLYSRVLLGAARSRLSAAR